MEKKERRPRRDTQINNDQLKHNLNNPESMDGVKKENTEKEEQGQQEANGIIQGNDNVKKEEIPKEKTELKDTGIEKGDTADNSNTGSSKKRKRPSSVSLVDKSELFKRIIDIAFVSEKLEKDRKRLTEENATLKETCDKLTEENAVLNQRLREGAALYQAKLNEISKLKTDIANRNEVIGIVKADKSESAQEYKNALAASLQTPYTDFLELKKMNPPEDDVTLGVIDTFERVITVLNKNGIILGK